MSKNKEEFEIIKKEILNNLNKNKILEITAIPNSSKSEIKIDKERGILVYLNSVPDKNKANNELKKLFKKDLNLNIELIKGEKNRKKSILIKN
jgi:uncharacterized protein (TIGR00251 family)